MKTKKLLFITIPTILVIAGGIALFCMTGDKDNNMQLLRQTVTKGNVSNYITATGTIEPVTEVTVGTQVSGIIDRIFVDYNATVKKGQLLAEMDKVNLNNELQSAEAAYAGAKAEFDYQRRLFRRNETLHAKQLISDTDYELSRYNYEKAASTYQQSKATLAKAQRNLTYATITSPIDGVVTSKSVEEGQTVAAGYSTPTLFTIAADLTKMQVVADVDEADIADVQPGNRVTFTVDAYPQDTFEGRVTQVRLGTTGSTSSTSTTSSSTETVVTYEVVISADNTSLKLKPRLTANVTIYTTHKENVLTVPNKALRFTPTAETVGKRRIEDTQATHKVWVEQGNTLKAIPVTIGLADNSNTEITSGISLGQSVITGIQAASGNEATTTSSGEQNPFMPSPPGSKKKK